MDDADDFAESDGLCPRPPEDTDLTVLCARLNEPGAKYVVVGGLAIVHAGYGRSTEDLDLLIDTSLDNEAKVHKALELLPDQAVKELDPGDVEKYSVVRVGDDNSDRSDEIRLCH